MAKRLLSPQVLDHFKFELADELGIPLNPAYNGDIKARDAGRIGGRIGGRMVKVMIKHAEEALARGDL